MTATLTDYAADVATKLAAAGLSLVKGTNLFNGPMRANAAEGISGQAVFCHVVGGLPAIDYCDNSASPQLHFPTVQIMVRSNPRAWDAGLALANNVYEAVHDQPPAGYVSARCAQSAPLYAGELTNGEFLWSINLDMIKEET